MDPDATGYLQFNCWRQVGMWVRLMNAIMAANERREQIIHCASARVNQHAAGSQGRWSRSPYSPLPRRPDGEDPRLGRSRRHAHQAHSDRRPGSRFHRCVRARQGLVGWPEKITHGALLRPLLNQPSNRLASNLIGPEPNILIESNSCRPCGSHALKAGA